MRHRRWAHTAHIRRPALKAMTNTGMGIGVTSPMLCAITNKCCCSSPAEYRRSPPFRILGGVAQLAERSAYIRREHQISARLQVQVLSPLPSSYPCSSSVACGSTLQTKLRPNQDRSRCHAALDLSKRWDNFARCPDTAFYGETASASVRCHHVVRAGRIFWGP